jgi:molecular chaperone GrpE
MRKRKQEKREAAEAADLFEEAESALDELEPEAVAVDWDAAGEGPAAEGASGPALPDEGELLEVPEAAIERLTQDVEEQKDKYLRLAAEFDNYRKRTLRERTETTSRAKAAIASAILEGLDDLDRVSQLDPEQTTAKDVIDGVEMVERKLMRELASAGVERVGVAGELFDPNFHEAVAAVPPQESGQEDQIAAVLQVGYRMGNLLLRPARVQVYVAPQPEEGTEA